MKITLSLLAFSLKINLFYPHKYFLSPHISLTKIMLNFMFLFLSY
ncbi:hypothetical protein CSC18_2357 [Klebsiella aerogenes]|nr:hypothetical protein CSC18_2357 [Klebsiella aerogenes]